MGFLKPKIPKPDPAIAASIKRQEKEAKADRISTLSEQLDTETRLLARRFGRRSVPGMNALSGVLGSALKL